jgi:uncharacterized membrane protein
MVIDAKKRQQDKLRIVYALAFSSLLSIILVLIGALKSGSSHYYFLIFNLWLSYFPLLFAVILVYRLKNTAWLSPINIILSLLWITFLPNSFYMISDLIHAPASIGYDLLFNIVMILFCVINSMIAGYISIYLIHWELLKRFYFRYVHLFIGLVLFICSFAIYMGRFLRWNSWSVITNPAGLLFDISDTITNPSMHPDVFPTITSFFFLLLSIYIIIWQITLVFKKPKLLKNK